MRRLIINADDLGLTEGVNSAIFRAHNDGVVTSATLMANGAALQNAVAEIHAHAPSRLSIGCHLVLVDGEPLSTPETIPSLVKGTEFRRGIGELAIAARLGRLASVEIEAEATAQFSSLQTLGVRLSHFDAHKHSHMFPEILEPALRAAASCGIRAVRNPFEPRKPFPLSMLLTNLNLLKRYIQVQALGSMQSSWRNIVRRHGLATPDGSLGIIVTGDMNEALLHCILENVPAGTWELVCHPGYMDESLCSVRTRLRGSREQELALLTSPDTKRLIERLGIELISYAEL